jgi:TetR/AcrR family transcriptional regulator, fatty acid metabolism regulator protein
MKQPRSSARRSSAKIAPATAAPDKTENAMARATTRKTSTPGPAPWDSPRRSGKKPSFIEEARRKQILDKSLELIARRGYDNTSLADIADAVGVSKGVISYHFDGKSDLGKQVLRHWMRQYNRYVTERLERLESPRARLLELPNACIDFAVERRDEAMVYLDTVGCFGTAAERHQFLAWAEAGMRQVIVGLIRQAREAGEIAAVAEGPLADILQAAIDGVCGQHGMNPEAVNIAGCKAMIRQMLLAVVGGKR